MKDLLALIAAGKSLTRAQASSALEQIIGGVATREQTVELLLGLRAKGATVDEISGFAQTMRAHAVPVASKREELIDVCGTGGDGAGTFNISTTVAFVLAGAGVGVAKHGNRSVSSKCGSSDVLEALQIKIDLAPENVVRSLDEIGLGFFFAPTFHPAMKKLAEIRRSLGVRTIFNILGPLVNPARLTHQVMGVFDRSLLDLMTNSLRELGLREAMVVIGEDGLDELTLSGKTFVSHLRDGVIKTYELTPEDAGLKRAPNEALSGGDPKKNARILEDIIDGQLGPKRDAVLLNAAAGLMVSGLATDLKAGVKLAAETIDKGRARDILDKMRAFQ